MGIAAGVQTIRSRSSAGFQDPNEEKSFIHDIFPLGIFYGGKQERKMSPEVIIAGAKYTVSY